MTKIVGYCALLYGKCYLDAAIRSVIDGVDEFWILHTEVGSHGHRTAAPSPDTRDELHDIAHAAAGRKLKWVTSQWTHEGEQRDRIFSLCPDASIVIPVDYDEIWQPHLLNFAINTALENPTVRRWRIPFRHYYRSFYRCILHDPAYPHRLYNVSGDPAEERTLDTTMAVNHMGYAIPPALMRFKWEVHGHRGELRRDVDYFTDVYEANRQTDCHPCGSIYWNAEPVDPFARPFFMPDYMREHPYAGMEVIP